MFRESGTIDNVKPYVNRALNDDDVRQNILTAFKAAKKVYRELSGEDAVGVARKFTKTDDVRADLDDVVESLSEAMLRVSGKRVKHRSGWAPFLLLAGAGFVFFNPVTGASTRKWVKDHLIGSEEEFDYATPEY